MQNAGWRTSWNQDCQEKYQQLQMCRWYHSMAESEEELKSLLIEVKEESEKDDLKFNLQKNQDHGIWSHHFMADNGETMETVRDFIFLGSKITTDGDCSHEIKRHLLLGRKAMTNLNSVLKGRDITLSTKVRVVKLWFFQ